MEMVLIIALLVSNVWLIRKVLNKPDAPTPEKPQEAETSPAPEPEEPTDIVGTSTFDIHEFTDSVRKAAKEAAVEAAKEAIPLIVKELGTPADAGLPEESEQEYPKQVPKEDFAKVFSNLSASELTGEPPARLSLTPTVSTSRICARLWRSSKTSPILPKMRKPPSVC